MNPARYFAEVKVDKYFSENATSKYSFLIEGTQYSGDQFVIRTTIDQRIIKLSIASDEVHRSDIGISAGNFKIDWEVNDLIGPGVLLRKTGRCLGAVVAAHQAKSFNFPKLIQGATTWFGIDKRSELLTSDVSIPDPNSTVENERWPSRDYGKGSVRPTIWIALLDNDLAYIVNDDHREKWTAAVAIRSSTFPTITSSCELLLSDGHGDMDPVQEAANTCHLIAEVLRERYSGSELPQKEICFPLEAKIAGYTERTNCPAGSILTLERDYRNQYDKNAIKVFYSLSNDYSMFFMGYISRNSARALAQYMDSGIKLYAELLSPEREEIQDTNRRIRFADAFPNFARILVHKVDSGRDLSAVPLT